MGVESKLVKGMLARSKEIGLLGRFADDIGKKLPKLVQIQGLTPELTSKFLDLTRHSMVPEVLVGHFSHLDPVVASDFCYKIKALAEEADLGKNLTGIVATLARSVVEGKQGTFEQGMFMREVYPKMEAYARQRGVELVSVTREKDVERYGMSKDIMESRLLVAKLRKRGMGALILPGGSVQAGRHPEGASGDEIFGLQEVTDTDTLHLFNSMERLGRHLNQQPYLLPVAVDGTYRIYSADSLLPTLAGIISFYDTPANFLKLFGFRRRRVTITPAMPQTSADMASHLGADWRTNPKEAMDFLMTEIARKLPPAARGYYGKFVREERLEERILV